MALSSSFNRSQHVSNPDRYSMEYWADWFLILRTEKEFMNLFDGNPIAEKTVIYDNSGIQMFLHIKKPQAVHSQDI